jgi:hypothetical protein
MNIGTLRNTPCPVCVTPYLMEMKCTVSPLASLLVYELCQISSACHGSQSSHATCFLHKLVSPVVFKSLSFVCCRHPCRNTWPFAQCPHSRLDTQGMLHCTKLTALLSTSSHCSSTSSSNVVFATRLRCHSQSSLHTHRSTCSHSTHLPPFGRPTSRALVYIDCDVTRSERGHLRHDRFIVHGIHPLFLCLRAA